MTDCMMSSYPPSSNNFAAMITNINQELQAKGHVSSAVQEDNRAVVSEAATSPRSSRSLTENTLRHITTDMRAQNYDVIRFATYRAACKLRFIQKKTNLHMLDLWNVIEAFREAGLTPIEPGENEEVPVSRLESLLTTLYSQLNKRLPTNGQIPADQSAHMLYSWLLHAYDPLGRGHMRVLSIKVSLTTLCSGKHMDKLRYAFTQICDAEGVMVQKKLEEYIKEVLTLPTAVYEGPSFGYNDTAARACFDGKSKVTVNDFLDTLMSDPGPQCLMWWPILQRMANVENVLHPLQCDACHVESFIGFRYKCQRCYNYHLCQECFWRGRTSGNHSNDHEVKEYSTYKSPAKQLSHSLSKKFRCVPNKQANHIPKFPEQPEKTLDLTHIVPATPPPMHNGFHDTSTTCLLSQRSLDVSSMDSSSAATKSPSRLTSSVDSGRLDDEHRLIARYAARLAADANNAARSPTELNYNLDASKAQHELIKQLESKNREILREIQRLRQEQEQQAKFGSEHRHTSNPTLLAELRLLRQRRDELEARMQALQDSRRELMVQLEGLMKLLKVGAAHSPRSTPTSSPRSRSAQSPPITLTRAHSNPTTPGATVGGDSLMGVGGDVRQAFGSTGGSQHSGSVKSLRNDLLVAADSVTNAMSSLVKELNSEASGSDDEDLDEECNKKYSKQSELDEFLVLQEEMHQRLRQESDFLRELHARKSRSSSRAGSESEHDNFVGDGYSREHSRDDLLLASTDDGESYVRTDDDARGGGGATTDDDLDAYEHELQRNKHIRRNVLNPARYTDDESCLETDQESYIRTDDEEGGNTEWEESMRRWVNR